MPPPPPDSPTVPGTDRVSTLSLASAAIFQVALVFQPLERLCERVLTDDDAYYYLRIARRIALDGWASFDGLHASNGVQLAWAALLVPVARLVPGEILYLRAVLLLAVLLNVLAGWQLLRLARRAHSRGAGVVVAGLWSGAMIAGVPTLTAMEYPLYVLVFATALGFAWELWQEPQALDRRRLAAGIGLVALLFWTRLDAALLAGLLVLLLTRAIRRSAVGAERRWRLASMVASLVFAGALCTAAFWWMGGTMTPISGHAKALLASRHFEGESAALPLLGRLVWWASIVLRSGLALPDPWVQRGPLAREPLTVGLSLAVLAALLLGLSRLSRSRAERRDRDAARATAALLVAATLHAALMVAVLGHFAAVTAHYFAPLWIALALGTSVVLAASPLPRRQLRIGVVAVCLAWLGVGTARALAPLDATALRVRRLELARWIDRTLPPEARIGAWNAGQLGYFSHRAVVNLDGLANDREYFEHLRAGAPLHDYLRRERIEFLADYDAPDLSMPYRADWDHQVEFRGALPWSELEILYADRRSEPHLFLVALRSPGRAAQLGIGAGR